MAEEENQSNDNQAETSEQSESAEETDVSQLEGVEQPKPEANQQVQPEPASDSQKKILKYVLIGIGVLVVLGILGTMLLGFFGAKLFEQAAEKATNTEIDYSNGSFSAENDQGSVQVNQAEIPDDFPETVPLYEDAETTSSSSFKSESVKTWTVSQTTEDSTDDVSQFYKEALSQDGWKTTSTSSFNNRTSYTAESDQYRISVTISQSQGQTQISLNVGENTDN